MYVRYPLSLRYVEDLLFERGIDICHETVRYWRNRFGCPSYLLDRAVEQPVFHNDGGGQSVSSALFGRSVCRIEPRFVHLFL